MNSHINHLDLPGGPKMIVLATRQVFTHTTPHTIVINTSHTPLGCKLCYFDKSLTCLLLQIDISSTFEHIFTYMCHPLIISPWLPTTELFITAVSMVIIQIKATKIEPLQMKHDPQQLYQKCTSNLIVVQCF